VQLVDNLVSPGVILKVEDDRVAAQAVADYIALVARCGVEVEARCAMRYGQYSR
jgi:hypothetical protein